VIHHLNCGTMCPVARMVGAGGFREKGRLVCHCLLIERPGGGLILVDSGFGTADCDSPRNLHGLFRALAAPVFDRAETAVEQVRALGFDPRDVTDIVVTHLDVDHAGGLADFPAANVHVHAAERRAALLGQTVAERQRYTAHHFAHGPRWRSYRDAGDDWFGFEAVRPLDGLADQVALIPLFGHSRGHSAVAVADGDRWILHAGDAFFHASELVDPSRCPAGLKLFQELVQFDRKLRLANAARLRDLHRDHADEVTIICAHDPSQLGSLQGA
jgi:glyoxylase-like metal-dependent hydrolase (beta-lactamase superfamily II)